MKHSIFGASSADRWANCAGSIPLSQGLADSSSGAAQEGTALHELSDRCLKDGSDPTDHTGEIIAWVEHGEAVSVEITDEGAQAAQEYVDYVRSIYGTRMFEQRVNYAELLGVDDDEGFGTTDCTVLDNTIVHVIDAKFGRNYVDPKSNRQMMLYGAAIVSAMESIGEEVTEVHLHVMQPRVVKKPVPFIMSRAELEQEIEFLRAAAQGVLEAIALFTGPDNADWAARYLNPSESACKYCRAAAFCPALRRTTLAFGVPAADFEAVTLAEAFDPEELVRRYDLIPLANIWIKALSHEVHRRLTLGQYVPGKHLVVGREGNRKFSSEEKALEVFADLDPAVLYAPAKLKTLPQLETAIKKIPDKAAKKELLIKLTDMTVRAPARPTVADKLDPREPWSGDTSIDEFAVVD